MPEPAPENDAGSGPCRLLSSSNNAELTMAPSIYPDLPEIAVRIDAGGVAVVVLDRPEARNAFTNPMKDSLVRCLRPAPRQG